VNNAGVHNPVHSWEMTEKSVRQTLDVNVLGTLACAGRALRAMREQGFGSVINTTSGAHMGLEWRPDYGASKGAVSSFTYTAAIELAGTGVRVNCMAPNVNTRMLDDMEQFMSTRGDWARPYLPPPETNTGIHLYLLSDRCRLNGQAIGIRHDGELFIWAHPAALEPTVVGKAWTAQAIAEAVEADKLAPPQALGFARVQSKPGAPGGFTGR
jgi:NAD(P)-dependent dehydrogenase (short-subunit alcohol dehydrogenase family)